MCDYCADLSSHRPHQNPAKLSQMLLRRRPPGRRHAGRHHPRLRQSPAYQSRLCSNLRPQRLHHRHRPTGQPPPRLVRFPDPLFPMHTAKPCSRLMPKPTTAAAENGKCWKRRPSVFRLPENKKSAYLWKPYLITCLYGRDICSIFSGQYNRC